LEGRPLVGLNTTLDLVIYARSCYYMLHDTWVQWTVSPCYQDPLTYHLFDMQLSCGTGHRMVALLRVMKHVRHIHLHHILHCLQWTNIWLIFSWYWHLRLMWHALSWLHEVPGLTILFYLVISCSCDLVIMLRDSYSSRTIHVSYIHVTTCMHDLLVYDLSFWFFLLLLLLSVLDTANHIVIIISMPYLYCYCIFIFSLLLCFSLRVLLLVRFCRTLLFFNI